MQLRQLGTTDLHISPLGFGSWAAGGGGWAYGWGPQDDADTVAAIHSALELGVNWIDTAPVYGLGHSEEVVAKALEGRADQALVFTKCGMVWNGTGQIHHALKTASIRKECEDSLRRLKRDRIDLYQIHWPNPDEDIEEGWTTLAKLKEEGKLRWIGVSNFSPAQLARARAIAPVASLQPAYSMLRRAIEPELMPTCARHGIGILAYSPMQAGLLTGAMTRVRVQSLPEDDWRRRTAEFQEPRLTKNLELQARLAELGARHHHSAAVVALAWVLRRPELTGAIVGARNAAQVQGWIAALEFRLSEAELAEIDGFLEAAK